MHRAKKFIDSEEENERIERELARTREKVTKVARSARKERRGQTYADALPYGLP